MIIEERTDKKPLRLCDSAVEINLTAKAQRRKELNAMFKN